MLHHPHAQDGAGGVRGEFGARWELRSKSGGLPGREEERPNGRWHLVGNTLSAVGLGIRKRSVGLLRPGRGATTH